MTENAKVPEVKKRAPTLYFIVAIKLIKGVLLLLRRVEHLFTGQQGFAGFVQSVSAMGASRP